MTVKIDPAALEYLRKQKQDSLIIGTRRTGG